MHQQMAYIIDLDGTIYKEDSPLPLANYFIEQLKKKGCEYRIFTNCSCRTPRQVTNRLKKMGINIDYKNIVTSGSIAKKFVSELDNPKIYVIGSESFKKSISLPNATIISGMKSAADYVIVGFEPSLNYKSLDFALWHLQNGAKLVTTNLDPTIPAKHGQQPHTGAVCAYLYCASGKQAINLGKPTTYSGSFFRSIFPNRQIYVIGDRLDTDMQFAKNNGFIGYLVLTGVTERQDESNPCKVFDLQFETLKDICVNHKLDIE